MAVRYAVQKHRFAAQTLLADCVLLRRFHFVARRDDGSWLWVFWRDRAAGTEEG
jgi:hypothetical protein